MLEVHEKGAAAAQAVHVADADQRCDRVAIAQ